MKKKYTGLSALIFIFLVACGKDNSTSPPVVKAQASTSSQTGPKTGAIDGTYRATNYSCNGGNFARIGSYTILFNFNNDSGSLTIENGHTHLIQNGTVSYPAPGRISFLGTTQTCVLVADRTPYPHSTPEPSQFSAPLEISYVQGANDTLTLTIQNDPTCSALIGPHNLTGVTQVVKQ
jgi:hypothetical protein